MQHSENGIFLTLFGILFWDILFQDMPNVFQSKHQNAPLDLDTDAFSLVRRKEIDQRVAELESGRAPDLIRSAYQAHNGERCVGVNWEYLEEFLVEAAGVLGKKQLASLCGYLAEDYRHRSTGMPDLFVWKINPPTCMLVEVKGPNDVLSKNQSVWMTAFEECHVDAVVCKVQSLSLFQPSPSLFMSETPSFISANRSNARPAGGLH